ncbi:MAG: hypothetical protein DLM63_04805 [Solirubrobacterales bacterium]|nr:MAG: hypothetical protein DLM63_04805 [Solirubrobacterales bacterium]
MPTITEEDRERGYRIDRPNRRKATSKATKAVVILLLLATAVLMLAITIGGWAALSGAKPVQIAFIVIYLIMAWQTARWSRGTLPLAAAFAIILGIFAVVAGPGWFDRDKTGFTNPTFPSNIDGLLTLLVIPIQLLLIAFAMRGFQQEWNVEVEIPLEDDGEHEQHRGAPLPA